MAISVTTPSPAGHGFFLNATSADASGCEELKAAPAAGAAITLDRLTINAAAAITVTIGEGETGGAVTTALIGPVAMAENSSLQWDFAGATNGLKLTAATSLTVDASGAGAICIFARGRVE